jgi:hypothetical protein
VRVTSFLAEVHGTWVNENSDEAVWAANTMAYSQF